MSWSLLFWSLGTTSLLPPPKKIRHSTIFWQILAYLVLGLQRPLLILFVGLGSWSTARSTAMFSKTTWRQLFGWNNVETQAIHSFPPQQPEATQCLSSCQNFVWIGLWNLTTSTPQSWSCTKALSPVWTIEGDTLWEQVLQWCGGSIYSAGVVVAEAKKLCWGQSQETCDLLQSCVAKQGYYVEKWCCSVNDYCMQNGFISKLPLVLKHSHISISM